MIQPPSSLKNANAKHAKNAKEDAKKKRKGGQ
jgi:hypothetical protein